MPCFSLQHYQSHVRDLLDMLRACVCSTPSLLGSTVWGMTDIHKVLSSIAPAQKEKPQPLYFVKVCISSYLESILHFIWTGSIQEPKLKAVYLCFLVNVASKMDVSGAYESLPHNKLIEVINQVLTPVLNEVFTIRRFAKIWADSHEGLKKAFIRQVKEMRNEHSSAWTLFKKGLILHHRQISLKITWDPSTWKGFWHHCRKKGSFTTQSWWSRWG